MILYTCEPKTPKQVPGFQNTIVRQTLPLKTREVGKKGATWTKYTQNPTRENNINL